MPSLAIIGAQWGDEGKGKIIDVLSEDTDLTVRFQGGNNAGHTVVIQDEEYVLHILPSGVLHEGILNVIGNGVVVDPGVLFDEIDGLAERGIQVTPDQLRVSERAHLIFPHHRTVDRKGERRRGKRKIGTTGRGIGPCYSDKAARNGIRVVDLFDEETFQARLEGAVAHQNEILTRLYDAPPLDLEEIRRAYLGYAERLAPYVEDTIQLLNDAYDDGKRILIEGAQGTFLDVDFGTYPYVTSSNASACGISGGTALPPSRVDHVVGVLKAYTTRVGEGPFPAELDGKEGERLREAGSEYGATTGRPRRCGWFDLVMARQSARVNGFSGIALTKLDILDELDEIRVATAYEIDGERWTTVPARVDLLQKARPIYRTFEGWSKPTEGAQSFDELPDRAVEYVEALEKELGVPIWFLSTGRRRRELIVREEPWGPAGR